MTLTHLLTLIGRLSPPSFGLMLMSYRARSVFWGSAHATDSEVSVLDSNSMEATPVGTEIHKNTFTFIRNEHLNKIVNT